MAALERFLAVLRRLNPRGGHASTATQADRARGEQIRGQGFAQTADEQAGTRQRMEAELDTQREQRAADKDRGPQAP